MSYIIEHPTRGILMDIEYESWENAWKPRWSWSKPRSEARRFPTRQAAGEARHKLPEQQRKFAEIRDTETYKVVG